MPDVIIKGMEMPENCTKCFMLRNCNLRVPTEGRNNDCPLRPAPEWISVEERLLDEWREVLAYMPIHSDEKNPHMIRICWYIGNGKWRETEYGEIVELRITHWMPLPEPPKGGADHA